MHSTWYGGDQSTVVDLITSRAQMHPDRPFVDFSGDIYSYADIDRLSTQLAAGLVSLGLKAGDRLVSILDNNIDSLLCWIAANKVGAISVPANTALKGEFLRHLIDDAGARLVVAEEDYATRILELQDQLPTLDALIHKGNLAVNGSPGFELLKLDQVKACEEEIVLASPAPGDLSLLVYTSGTTGPSKGCMISHNFVCNLARQSLYCLEPTENDIVWTCLPLFHLNAQSMVLAMATIGARVVIYPRFSVSGFWPDIRRSGATIANMLGSMPPLIANMEDSEDAKACHGQIHTVSAAPFPKELQDRWKQRFGGETFGSVGYGMTEMAMAVYGKIKDDAPPGSSGKRQKDYEVMIVDDNDVEVPPGTPGEVVVRPCAPHVMFEGYWNRPEETVKSTKNLWFHTGDIGKFDDEGYFYFLDRKKDCLRRRGENISSFEMEKTFVAHPDIVDVAVHAVPSEVGEDDVKITAVLRDGSTLTEEALCRWSVERVPYFAVPRYVEFRNDLPRNPTGKVLKFQLRDEGCTPGTWDREKTDFELAKR